MKKRIMSILLTLVMVLTMIPATALTASAATANVYYKTHCQNVGWTGNSYNGATSGTTGRGLRVEAMQVRVSGMSGGITYRTHCQNIGWTGWSSNGATSGTTGRSLRVEAIQVKLTGEIAKNYNVMYRTHCQNIGWTGWSSNGATSGTTGQGLRVEAIQIKLVAKSNTTTSSQPIKDGYYTITTGSYGWNVQYAPKSGIGNFVLDSVSNLESNEVFYVQYVSAKKAYYITPKYRQNEAAANALYGKDCQIGSQMKLHPSNTSDTASLWYITKESNGAYRFQNVASGLYVTLGGRVTTGTKLLLNRKQSSGQTFWINGVNANNIKKDDSNQTSGFDPIWPCEKTYTVTALYKYSSGARHSCRFKYGIDIGAPKGENVRAVESGTVITSEYSTSSGFGNWIMIQHSNGKVSLYAHLNSRYVGVGAKVTKGQVIGQVGNTSAKYKIGAHLHFELGNSNTSGAAGDAYQEYFKTKYAGKIKLTQAAAKYNTP